MNALNRAQDDNRDTYDAIVKELHDHNEAAIQARDEHAALSNVLDETVAVCDE